MKNTAINFLENIVLKYPEKIAVVDIHNAYTFKELQIKAKYLANKIIKKTNYSLSKPIAVYLPKSTESIVSFMSALYSGNFYVPLDVKTPIDRAKKIIDNLKPMIVITDTALSNKVKELGIRDDKIICVDIKEEYLFSDKIIEKQIQRVIDTDPIYTIYTSGSTGTPKGVVVTHRGVIDYIEWAENCYKTKNDIIIGNQSPFYFDNSTLDIYLCMKSGATINIIPENLFAFPLKLMQYVEENRINQIFWVPSVMINIANAGILSKYEVKCLKNILFAGEVMPNKCLNYWRKYIPNALYSNLYGPTEITVDCTYYNVERKFEDNEPLPIGFPCRNSNVFIINDKNELCKDGETGELCVRGTSLAHGYWNDFEKTNAAFVQNPLNNNYPEKIYKTGDLVFVNELGEIIYVGRKDTQIKHMGYRIELGEIETAVLSLKNIYNACVLYDNEQQQIVLFYESKNDDLKDVVIRKDLINIIPKYMIPTKYHRFEKLPYNSNGKIDRVKLKNEYL